MTTGTRGFYEGNDGGKAWKLPRNVDPAQDGTRLAAHRPVIFDVGAAPDSVAIADFDQRLEATLPAETIARIDHVLEAGQFLATKGLADKPPIAVTEWRRGMILSCNHARDLDVIHDAMGHPRYLSNRHDLDEVVLAKHLQARLAAAQDSNADQWYVDYVRSLDEGAWVNVGFFNPHLSASMYKWGDAKKDKKQNAMEAHRLAAHHQGAAEAPLDWIERAVNFVIHHLPREHWGIRHEARGEYSDLEARLADDPSINKSEIGKVIARDATRLCELLEKEGKIVPWGLLDVPRDVVTPSMVEHAFLVSRAAPAQLEQLAAGEVDETQEPARTQRARSILDRLPALLEAARNDGRHDLAAAYEEFLAHG